jgi:hypothetical protein
MSCTVLWLLSHTIFNLKNDKGKGLATMGITSSGGRGLNIAKSIAQLLRGGVFDVLSSV